MLSGDHILAWKQMQFFYYFNPRSKHRDLNKEQVVINKQIYLKSTIFCILLRVKGRWFCSWDLKFSSVFQGSDDSTYTFGIQICFNKILNIQHPKVWYTKVSKNKLEINYIVLKRIVRMNQSVQVTFKPGVLDSCCLSFRAQCKPHLLREMSSRPSNLI